MRSILSGCVAACFAVILVSSPLFAGSNKEKPEKEKKGNKAKRTEQVTETREPVPVPEFGEPPNATAKKKAQEHGSIKGRVLNEAGLPVQGADVFCIDASGAIVAKTLTDENGLYEVSGLLKGEYTISVSSRGTAGPLEIRFPDSTDKPPPPPGRLSVRELDPGALGKSGLRAEWEKVESALSYRCELSIKGQDSPIAQRSDIIQKFYEFEDLEEDTEYEVRVFAKNDAGYSERYASATLRTAFRLPPPPTGLGVTYAKNNRVDLVWNAGSIGKIKGYVIQVAKESGSYLNYTPQGLTSDRSKAFIVEETEQGEVRYSVEGFVTGTKMNGNTRSAPILENLTPYSFRVFAIDRRGTFSKPSSPVTGIVIQDTVPPRPPEKVKHEFIGTNKLRISWESPDRDVVKYRISYGFDRDRWDGVVFTEKTSYDIVYNRSQLRNKELIVNITAIDRAGNESGIRPIEKKETVTRGETTTEDIVVTSENVYRDYSFALRPSVKAQKEKVVSEGKVEQKPVVSRTIGLAELRAKGFVIEKGITAHIEGKVKVPENTIIRVAAGGSLLLDGADIGAETGLWGGIRFLAGSSGLVRNSVLADAAVGLAIVNNDNGVKVSNLEVFDCAENGIYIENSRVELSFVALQRNKIGLFVENSRVVLSDSVVRLNEKGILANNYNLTVFGTKVEGNREYGLRLYGGGRVEKSSFKDNLVGIVLEQGRGSVPITGSRIELNLMDGIVSSASNADITDNLISSNGRHGIYLRDGANPNIVGNDIINNRSYGVIGGGRVVRSFVAYNNGSPYYDDTEEKGKPDNVLSSSSSGPVKQILSADYISNLSFSSVLR